MDTLENYYDESAFSLSKHDFFHNENVIVTEEHIDLRLFSDCPYYMGQERSSSWYRYIKKSKPHGFFITKKYIRWLMRMHKQLFKAEFGSTSSFFSMIQLLAVCGLWVYGGGFCLLTIYDWLRDPYRSLLEEFQSSGTFWVIGISYVVMKLAKFGANYYDDECGLIFDRPSGKVKFLNIKGDITGVYDFKNFTPKLKTFINTGGQKERTALISSTKDCQSVVLAQGLVSGAIAWSYLVRFMDVTQPLPDIPVHETTRHLDPVTKAYDEKIGRAPKYWAKQDRKDVRVLEKEAYEKAKTWVAEREAVLNKKGIEDLNFLNNLINPAASMTE
tara:strand:- start:895 stop:1884 length:990 start_codon:yes stop_codon:yes gene_type:complete